MLLISNAQTWEYSQHISVSTKAELRGLTLDSDTNLYVTAFHKDGATITGPGGTEFASTAGAQDIILMKVNPHGEILWRDSIYGALSDYPRQIELDNNEDPYIAGKYRRANLNIQSTVLPQPSDNNYDIFLAKYTSAGADQFARLVAWGPGNDEVDKISLDNSNHVYMSGTFSDSIYFEGDTLFTPTPAEKHIFLAKFKPNGDFIWAKQIPLTTTTGNYLEIEVSNFSEIYLAGFFTGDLNFDGNIVSSRGAAEDIVLTKMDSAGTFLWMRTAGSTDLADRGNGLTVDAAGSVYITGYFSGTSDFEGTNLISAGGFDMFLAKYNNGGTLLWTSRNGDIGDDIAYGAKVRENILLTTGYYSGTVTFNNKTLTSQSTGDANTGFFVYDTDGNPITAEDVKTNAVVASDRGDYIEYDLAGNTYIGGYFESDSLFIGSDTLIRTASTHDAFFAKYVNPFSATFSTVINPVCNGGVGGKLITTSYFGAAPYIYEWSPNVSVYLDSAATSLSAGDYWVKITDALGDTVRIYQTLTEPLPIVITTDSTNITCNGFNDGSLLAGATGGTAPYTYNWTGQNAVPGDSAQTSLQPGKYIVTVTDAAACIAKDSVTLTEPNEITFGPVTLVPESPINSYTGEIHLNVQGGTSPYTYEWDPIEPY
jgi:hypothetical protein